MQVVLDAGFAVAAIGGDGPWAPPGPADDPPDRGGELRSISRVAALEGVVEDDTVVVVHDLALVAELDRTSEAALRDRAGVPVVHVARARDLRDFTDMMLATGLRIGETAAVTWDALDLDAATVEARGTVIRITGQGLTIKWKPNTRKGWRSLELPTWAVEMLRRRRPADARNEDPVFTAPLGGLRDPSNTNADLREAFDGAGYPWVTSHVYRKTVATLMDIAGLSARAAADQLGHAKVSMTQDNYFGRQVARTGAADVMESIIDRT